MRGAPQQHPTGWSGPPNIAANVLFQHFVVFGRVVHQIDYDGYFFWNSNQFAVAAIETLSHPINPEHTFGTHVPNVFRNTLYLRLYRFNLLAKPMQLVCEVSIKKATALHQLLSIEHLEQILTEVIQEPTLHNNGFDLPLVGVDAQDPSLQLLKLLSRSVQTYGLRINCSLNGQPIPPQCEIHLLSMTDCGSSLSGFHRADGPPCGRERKSTTDDCLEVIDPIAPRISAFPIGSRRRFAKEDWQDQCRQNRNTQGAQDCLPIRHQCPPAMSRKVNPLCQTDASNLIISANSQPGIERLHDGHRQHDFKAEDLREVEPQTAEIALLIVECVNAEAGFSEERTDA